MTFAILICRKASFLGTPPEDFIAGRLCLDSKILAGFLEFWVDGCGLGLGGH